jgi:hypothetical protein
LTADPNESFTKVCYRDGEMPDGHVQSDSCRNLDAVEKSFNHWLRVVVFDSKTDDQHRHRHVLHIVRGNEATPIKVSPCEPFAATSTVRVD